MRALAGSVDCEPWTVVPFISRVSSPSGDVRTSVTPKKLRSRNSAGGWRTNVARTRTKAVAMARNHGRAPTSRIEAADEEPADAGLGRERAGRDEGDHEQRGGDEVRQHPLARSRRRTG